MKQEWNCFAGTTKFGENIPTTANALSQHAKLAGYQASASTSSQDFSAKNSINQNLGGGLGMNAGRNGSLFGSIN